MVLEFVLIGFLTTSFQALASSMGIPIETGAEIIKINSVRASPYGRQNISFTIQFGDSHCAEMSVRVTKEEAAALTPHTLIKITSQYHDSMTSHGLVSGNILRYVGIVVAGSLRKDIIERPCTINNHRPMMPSKPQNIGK